jgi:hypothetical protein
MIRKYRIVSVGGADAGEQSQHEHWHDELDGAEAEVARRLDVDAAGVGARRRTINVDPVVVMHGDARWRSRGAWQYRGEAGTSGAAAQARVYEMLRIDEAEYDH